MRSWTILLTWCTLFEKHNVNDYHSQDARHDAKRFAWNIFCNTEASQRRTHKRFLINADHVTFESWACVPDLAQTLCFFCLSLSIPFSVLNRLAPMAEPCTKYHSLGSSQPKKNEKGTLSSLCLKWLEQDLNGTYIKSYSALHPFPLPGNSARPLLCQSNVQWWLLCVRSRQLSSVWKNTRISHPRANGRSSPSATARSKALSLTQLWFAAATTSSLTCRWNRFQVRPARTPSFSGWGLLRRKDFLLPSNILWA